MSKTTILIIDDEPQICKLLEINLGNNGYQVLLAENAKLGIALAASHQPDLIILDIELPDRNGLEVLSNLKQWYTGSVMMLSVLNDEEGIVKALDQGASDYLCKPFRTAELLARIRSCLRRLPDHKKEPVVEFGSVQIDFTAHLVRKNNVVVKLTQTEYNLLQLLVQHQGRVLTQSFLLKEIWGVGLQKESQYLRVFIATLRKKIEDEPAKPKHILTENGIGYRFQL
jgi:two-component system KDP operon response regulator KdpE